MQSDLSYYKNHNQIQNIIDEIEKYQNKGQLIFIGVAGVPGIGKTTFCRDILLPRLQQAIIIPMDGYHIYRKHLDENGLKFRGAPYTFNKDKFKQDLLHLKITNEGSFPSFEHSIKDPVEDTIIVTKNIQFVIVEGLYLFLKEWELTDLFDLRIFLQGDLIACVDRLAQRHLQAGICHTIDEAKNRAQENDYKNALYIIQNSVNQQFFRVDV